MHPYVSMPILILRNLTHASITSLRRDSLLNFFRETGVHHLSRSVAREILLARASQIDIRRQHRDAISSEYNGLKVSYNQVSYNT